MQLEQRFELPASPVQAWPSFKDVGLLVDCLPGASLTGPAVDGEWPLRFDVKLGPISAAFTGQGRVSFDDEQRSGRFEGQATDRRTQSRVKGAAAFRLEKAASGTLVCVSLDYALTGSLAQFGRAGIVRELAAALTSQFAGNLASRLAQPEESADGTNPAADSGATATPSSSTSASPSQPLSAFGLLWQVLKTRCQQWLRRMRGQTNP